MKKIATFIGNIPYMKSGFKVFGTKNTTTQIIYNSRPIGLGLLIDFDPVDYGRSGRFTVQLDLVFISLWFELYKK